MPTKIDAAGYRTAAVPDGMHRLAGRLARTIEADIVAAGWPVGMLLGSEAELIERYGVSRAVLREAIRLLEHHDVAGTRRGPAGGLVVRAPDSAPVITSMAIYLEFVGATVEDLLDVRLLIEPIAARLAAEKLTEDGLVALRETLRIEQTEKFNPTKRDLLHVTIAELSGNAALHLFIAALAKLTTHYAKQPRLRSKAAAADLASASDHAHTSVVDAIIAGDIALAEQRTTRHLEAMRTWMLTARQQPIGRSNRSGQIPEVGSAKRAEILARQIIREIVERGATVGDVIGSEPDFLLRYGVSRAVFREAVRLLEYHSVARMRRGPGGGLMVAEPDPTASMETIGTYLDYRGIAVDDLRIVRDALEIGALDSVAERRGEPAVRERLLRSLDVESPVTMESVRASAHGMHNEIAELSGNRVLSLFLGILISITARHSADEWREPSTDIADRVSHVHRGIVEALLSGDVALARHRMRRHLAAISDWWV